MNSSTSGSGSVADSTAAEGTVSAVGSAVGSAVVAVTSVGGGVGGGVGTDEGIVSGGGTGGKRESGRVRVAWDGGGGWDASDCYGRDPWLAGWGDVLFIDGSWSTLPPPTFLSGF